MRRITTNFLICLSVAFTFLTVNLTGQARAADVIVGVASNSAVHQQVGRALCRAVQVSIQGVTCEMLPIEGRDAAAPLAVLSNVRNGAIEMGLVTTDWAHYAQNGTGPVKFLDAKFDNLRTLLMLHGEPLTIVARRDSGIQTIADLKGKRVNIGSPGSNQRAVMEKLMVAQGWTRKSFQLVEELTEPEQYLALCHNRVQAVVTITAHPNPQIAKALKLCDASLVSVTGDAVQKLIAAQPYFAPLEIPARLYAGQANNIPTFGVRVGVIATSDTSDDLAYAIVKAVLEDVKAFTKLHPALRHLKDKDMAERNVEPTYHSGAVRYFRERGMM